jgi:gamma-glutamyl-gamma-aminobutyrate hydrolase PuuD
MILGYVPYGTGQFSPFDQVFDACLQVNSETVSAVDCLVIWGGEDISPSIYNHPVSKYTYASENLSHRDRIEVSVCNRAMELGIPIIGICRGAQLLCALAGGSLVQHVTGHGRTHNIVTKDGEIYSTSSVHHQMMYPFDIEHEMIAWSDEKRSHNYINGEDKEIPLMHEESTVEPEIVWFPKIKGLAVQGHPEFMDEHCAFVHYVNTLVKEYCFEPTNV